MKLFLRFKLLIYKIHTIWRSRSGAYISSKSSEKPVDASAYCRRLGNTTYLVSAVFRETGTETVLDRISSLLNSRTRYANSLCLDAKADFGYNGEETDSTESV